MMFHCTYTLYKGYTDVWCWFTRCMCTQYIVCTCTYCRYVFRVLTQLVSANCRRASSLNVTLRSTKLAFSVTSDQLTLLLRLMKERVPEDPAQQPSVSKSTLSSQTGTLYSIHTSILCYILISKVTLFICYTFTHFFWYRCKNLRCLGSDYLSCVRSVNYFNMFVTTDTQYYVRAFLASCNTFPSLLTKFFRIPENEKKKMLKFYPIEYITSMCFYKDTGKKFDCNYQYCKNTIFTTLIKVNSVTSSKIIVI